MFTAFSDSDTETNKKKKKKIDKITQQNTLENSRPPRAAAAPRGHPLLTDLDPLPAPARRARAAERWFQQDAFQTLEADHDEAADLDRLANNFKQKGTRVASHIHLPVILLE